MKYQFHEGERYVQNRTGKRQEADQLLGMINTIIPKQAVDFIKSQHLLILSTLDQNQTPLTFALVGQPGFIHSHHNRQILNIKLSEVQEITNTQQLKIYSPLGLLFIDLMTRIRLRVNGYVSAIDQDYIEITVEHAYPNCPKYIQKRSVDIRKDANNIETIEQISGKYIDNHLDSIITKADTFFIGSSDNEQHFDVSHRGGHKGFVEVIDYKTFRVPDYPGNNLFNTLGNIHINPSVSLLFIDFTNNIQYHLSGSAIIEYDIVDYSEKTKNTSRWWTFKLDSWHTTAIDKNFSWTFIDQSPFLPKF